MNIANKLTIFRIVISPLLIVFLKLKEKNQIFSYLALLVFLVASLTDFLDGFIARKKNLITNLGKFRDPLADKILITAAYWCFLELKLISVYVVFLMFTREFLVFLIRLVASKNNKVLAANFLGKFKTVTQILASILTLLYIINNNSFLFYSYNTLVYISTILTTISGVVYIKQNIKLLTNN